MDRITVQTIKNFENHLVYHEKSKPTIRKYIREIERLAEFLQGNEITKARVLEYRTELRSLHKAQTVNGKLSAVNAFFSFCGLESCRVRLLKVQRQAFIDETRELSEAEYKRLLAAAKRQGNERLYLLMLTLGGTGIRIGELPYITVEAARAGRTEISLKGKSRTIILQKELRARLLQYAKTQSMESGHIFRTKSGKPVDCANICHDMKKLCADAKVNPRKVFPHNLRHLFARSFYAVEKNLAHLADVLGHSRIETTRIYVAVSIREHERILRRMKLVV